MKVEKPSVALCFAGQLTHQFTQYFYPSEAKLISSILKANSVKKLVISALEIVDEAFLSHILSIIGEVCEEFSFRYRTEFEGTVNGALTNTRSFPMILQHIRNRPVVQTLKYSWGTEQRPGLDSRENWPIVYNLRNLYLEFDSRCDFVLAEQLKTAFPNLESFAYKDDGEESPGMWSIMTNDDNELFHSLKRMKIQNFPEHDAVPWGRLRNLEALELHATYSVNDVNFYPSCVTCFNAVQSRLKHLKVTLPVISPFAFPVNGLASFFQNLPNRIETLVLKFGILQVDGVRQNLERVVQRCPNVKKISLLCIGRVSVQEFRFLFRSLPMLEELVIEESHTLENVSITRAGVGAFNFADNVETVKNCERLFFPFPDFA